MTRQRWRDQMVQPFIGASVYISEIGGINTRCWTGTAAVITAHAVLANAEFAPIRTTMPKTVKSSC